VGALFEAIIPSTPLLIKAYGQRISAISNQSLEDPAGGGSIWAAATSGGSAIAVHLLSCVIARIWTSAEAISILTQLVSKRKHEITACYLDVSFAAIAAAQQDISRADLADWDASVRSWLRNADQVKMFQQKQLMLILNNLPHPTINNQITLYESILKMWNTGMVTMESLIAGIPQAMRDRSALLCLSSWHLYPDLCILGSTFVNVSFQDPLITPGGIVTIGLPQLVSYSQSRPSFTATEALSGAEKLN
jgi:hypothetical protein